MVRTSACASSMFCNPSNPTPHTSLMAHGRKVRPHLIHPHSLPTVARSADRLDSSLIRFSISPRAPVEFLRTGLPWPMAPAGRGVATKASILFAIGCLRPSPPRRAPGPSRLTSASSVRSGEHVERPRQFHRANFLVVASGVYEPIVRRGRWFRASPTRGPPPVPHASSSWLVAEQKPESPSNSMSSPPPRQHDLAHEFARIYDRLPAAASVFDCRRRAHRISSPRDAVQRQDAGDSSRNPHGRIAPPADHATEGQSHPACRMISSGAVASGFPGVPAPATSCVPTSRKMIFLFKSGVPVAQAPTDDIVLSPARRALLHISFATQEHVSNRILSSPSCS